MVTFALDPLAMDDIVDTMDEDGRNRRPEKGTVKRNDRGPEGRIEKTILYRGCTQVSKLR